MAKLKGFYFSMDAMMASMILLALASMLLSYSSTAEDSEKPLELEKLETAAIQQVNEWNKSKNSTKKVLSYIFAKHYKKPSKTGKICDKYFEISGPYALYASNSTKRTKICGSMTDPSQYENLKAEQTLIPDQPIDSQFKGSHTATLVVKN
jgi:hypothetical protein